MEEEVNGWGVLLPINNHSPIQLTDYDVWLGRGDECHPDSMYSDIMISKLHCRIFLEQDPETGEFVPWIYDNSSNGTFVNGDLLGKGNQTVLREGDYITLAVQSTHSSDFTDESVAYAFSDRRHTIPGLIPQDEDTTVPESTPTSEKKKKKKKKGSRRAEPEFVPEPVPEPELELELEPEPEPSPTKVRRKKKSGSRSGSAISSATAIEPEPQASPESTTATQSKLRERLERRKQRGSSGIIHMKETDREKKAAEAEQQEQQQQQQPQEPQLEVEVEAEPAPAPAKKRGSKRSERPTPVSAPEPEPEPELELELEPEPEPVVIQRKAVAPAPAPAPALAPAPAPAPKKDEPPKELSAAQKRILEKQRQRASVASVTSQFEEKKQKQDADQKLDKKKLLSASMNPETPAEFVSSLKIEPLPRVLQSLRSYLQDGEWLQKFVDLDGFIVLIDNLVLKSRKFKKTNLDLAVEIEIVKCLKVLVNDEYGLQAAFAMGVNFFGPFVLSIESDNKRMRRRVPKIMACVAAYSAEGHQSIIEALNYFKKIKNERLRFQKIVKALTQEEDLVFRVNILLLINALINFPPEVENRNALRDEFLRLGLKEALDALKAEEDQALFTQVEQFFQEMENDQREVQMRGIDITNPTAIVDLLTSQLYGTPAFNHFAKIIQQFLLIRNTPEGREQWVHLSGVVQHELVGDEELELSNLKARVESNLEEGEATIDGDTAFMRKELLDLKKKFDKVVLEKLEEQRKTESERKTLLDELTRLRGEVQVLKGLPSLASLTAAAPAEAPAEEGSAPPPPPPPGAPPPPPGAPKGPPPPPGAPGKGGRKARFQPSVQMKQVYWNKIQERKIEGTIWKGLSHEKIDLEPSEIEDLFAARKKKEKEKEEVKKEEGPKVVSFVDLKRANNVGIMLASFKLTDGAIRRAILDFDETVLTAEKTTQLLKNLPTVEEEEILRNYQGEPSQLGRVEQLFHQLVTVPRLKSRLEVLNSRWTLPDKLADVSHNIETITLACREIISNNSLAKILEVLLAIGNFMNFGPMKPVTAGFRVEFLTKLRDVRSNDNKSTLLHYLANFLSQRFPELLEFTKEIGHVEPASKISQKIIQTEVSALKSALEQIRSELKTVDNKDGLFEVMQPFYDDLRVKLEALTTDMTVMNEWLKKTVEWFGEDSNVPVEEILQNLSTFAINLDVAVRDNAREKVLIEKNKRLEEQRIANKLAREEAKAKALEEQRAQEGESQASASRPAARARPSRKGVLDKVQTQLRTGTIYRGKKGQQMLEEDWEPDDPTDDEE